MRIHRPLWAKRSKKRKKPTLKSVSPLKRACNEFGRPDLYPVIGRAIILNPKLAKRNLKYVLKARRYRTAACVMLYDSKLKEARGYFKMALKNATNEAARERLTVILKNFPTVAKIAQRSWNIAGKYRKQKRKLPWRQRRTLKHG